MQVYVPRGTTHEGSAPPLEHMLRKQRNKILKVLWMPLYSFLGHFSRPPYLVAHMLCNRIPYMMESLYIYMNN